MNNASFLVLSKLTSFDEARFLYSQKQIYDTSCGYASVATVMNNWYGEDVSEQDLIEEIYEGSEETYTTSLKNLMTLLENHGYYIKAYKMDYKTLVGAAQKYAPMIVHFSEDGKGHFVVVLYADEGTVLVSDPSSGTQILFKKDFEKLFSGNVLLIHNENLDVLTLERVIATNEERITFLQRSHRFL